MLEDVLMQNFEQRELSDAARRDSLIGEEDHEIAGYVQCLGHYATANY